MRRSIKYFKYSLLVSTHQGANLNYECNSVLFWVPTVSLLLGSWRVGWQGYISQGIRLWSWKGFWNDLTHHFMVQMKNKEQRGKGPACPRPQGHPGAKQSFQWVVFWVRQTWVHTLAPLVTWDSKMSLGFLTHRRRLIISVLLHCTEDQMRKYMLGIWYVSSLTFLLPN